MASDYEGAQTPGNSTSCSTTCSGRQKINNRSPAVFALSEGNSLTKDQRNTTGFHAMTSTWSITVHWVTSTGLISCRLMTCPILYYSIVRFRSVLSTIRLHIIATLFNPVVCLHCINFIQHIPFKIKRVNCVNEGKILRIALKVKRFFNSTFKSTRGFKETTHQKWV